MACVRLSRGHSSGLRARSLMGLEAGEHVGEDDLEAEEPNAEVTAALQSRFSSSKTSASASSSENT